MSNGSLEPCFKVQSPASSFAASHTLTLVQILQGMLTLQADLSSVAGQIAAAHEQQTPNSSQARDGIGDRHEGTVQGWRHPPHRLVPTHTGQPEFSHHGAKHSAR